VKKKKKKKKKMMMMTPEAVAEDRADTAARRK
jgi:hypothetical protein